MALRRRATRNTERFRCYVLSASNVAVVNSFGVALATSRKFDDPLGDDARRRVVSRRRNEKLSFDPKRRTSCRGQ
jgi:hypothetical protein